MAAEFNAKYIDLFNTPLTTDAANYTLILEPRRRPPILR